MFPVLDLLHPNSGESLLRYRLDRLPAAKVRAGQYGAKGAMFPWTSELTGFGTTNGGGKQCPPDCMGLDWTEQHITGDIAMAFRLHWRSTADLAFLAESWPLIEAVCDFWASRLVTDATSGNYTVKGVVGPDEPAGKNDDEICKGISTKCPPFTRNPDRSLARVDPATTLLTFNTFDLQPFSDHPPPPLAPSTPVGSLAPSQTPTRSQRRPFNSGSRPRLRWASGPRRRGRRTRSPRTYHW